MELAEHLLSLLSHEPDGSPSHKPGMANALALLSHAFPGFEEEIEGKDVLDFGCGLGLQSVAMVQRGARRVLGLDTNPKTIAKAMALAAADGLDARLAFADRLDENQLGQFDVVISQNSMEHFPDPYAVIRQMKAALRPGGMILITFGPPWFAPYGSHMSFFTSVPWVNILFPERAVMSVRSRFMSDGAARYEDVEGGLNRMTVAKFERIISQCGLDMSGRRFECVKGLSFLAKLPFARELFINHVSCVLR